MAAREVVRPARGHHHDLRGREIPDRHPAAHLHRHHAEPGRGPPWHQLLRRAGADRGHRARPCCPGFPRRFWCSPTRACPSWTRRAAPCSAWDRMTLPASAAYLRTWARNSWAAAAAPRPRTSAPCAPAWPRCPTPSPSPAGHDRRWCSPAGPRPCAFGSDNPAGHHRRAHQPHGQEGADRGAGAERPRRGPAPGQGADRPGRGRRSTSTWARPWSDEKLVLPALAMALSARFELPLSLDTSDPEAMENALWTQAGFASGELHQRRAGPHGAARPAVQEVRRAVHPAAPGGPQAARTPRPSASRSSSGC